MKEWSDLIVSITGFWVVAGIFSVVLIWGYFDVKTQMEKYPTIPVNEVEEVNGSVKLCTLVDKPNSSHDDYVKIQLDTGNIYRIDREIYESKSWHYWKDFVKEIDVGDYVELKVWGERIVEIKFMGRTYFDLTESNHLYIAYNETLISQRKILMCFGVILLILDLSAFIYKKIFVC